MRVKDDPAARLRVLMAERDVNTQELAEMTGVSRKTISSLRTGMVKRPKRETAELIARALNVKLNTVFPDM